MQTIEKLEDIPEGYRHMFYPPKVVDINLDITATGSFPMFDFNAAAKDRARKLSEMFFDILCGGEFTPPEKSEAEKLLSRLKYAYIHEGGNRRITYVDNETMKAYRMHDNHYYNGLLVPLQEIETFTFERWCRGMDL